MDNETIVAGVGVGGLQDKYDIKILICYLLYTVNSPLSREQLNYVFQDGSFANYFSFCDALSELISSQHISAERNEFDEIYTLNDFGKETAQKLNHLLPSSLKDNIVLSAMQLLAKIKHERENEVIIKPCKNGFDVHCIIHDVEFDLMDFRLFAPDKLQAEKIKENFLKNPSKIYQTLIQLLVENN